MLVIILILIVVLLALILFTIAVANPGAFWSAVLIVLTLCVVGGLVTLGYLGIRWLIALDLDEVSASTEQFVWIFAVLGVWGVGAFLWTHWQIIVETTISIAMLLLIPAAAFLLASWLTSLVGVNNLYPGLSIMIGIVATVPAAVVSLMLGSRLSARMRNSGLSNVEPSARDID